MPEIKQEPPKYLQIANHFKTAIQSGEYEAGDALPSIRRLADDWSVSRPTALKALEVLKSEGVATLRQGAGTFVTGRGVSFLKLDEERLNRASSTGRIYQDGQRASILSGDVVEPSDSVRDSLQVEPGASVVRRERLIIVDDNPTEYSVTYYEGGLAEECPKLLETERILEGTDQYVTSRTGRFPSRVREMISARRANETEVDLLNLEGRDDQTVLLKEHLTFDQEGNPLSYTVSSTPPSNWVIENSYLL